MWGEDLTKETPKTEFWKETRNNWSKRCANLQSNLSNSGHILGPNTPRKLHIFLFLVVWAVWLQALKVTNGTLNKQNWTSGQNVHLKVMLNPDPNLLTVHVSQTHTYTPLATIPTLTTNIIPWPACSPCNDAEIT